MNSMPKMASREQQFTDELRSKHGVAIVNSIETLPNDLGAIFLQSVDERQQLE